MKRFLLASLWLGASLATASLFAQQSDAAPPAAAQGAHHPDPQQHLQRLTKMLQLTPDQQAKIGSLLQSSAQQMEAIRGDSSLKGPDRRAKLLALSQSTQDGIGNALTEQQRERWNAMREKMQERREERRQGQSSSDGAH